MAELLTASNANDVASYNGVTFGYKTETLSVDIRPVADGSGRTVAYNVYTITIRGPAYVAGGSTESILPDMRTRLTAYAGEFRYVNKGLGPLIINIPGGGGTRDVIWGPKPTLLRFKPMGIAAEVTWSVEIAIPDCEHAQTQFRLMEFVFRLVFSIDSSGYTRRTYSGYLRIPQTRRSVRDKKLSDTADRYRETIVPVLPPGFQRISQDYPLSEDKCRLDFTIVDEEMPPNIPPPGIQRATASHSISTSDHIASTTRWHGTLQASYEVGRDQDKSVAFHAFARWLQERRQIIERNAFVGPVKDPSRVIVNSFSMSEPEVYGRQTASFSASYTVLLPRKHLLKASGLWQPLGDSDWRQWVARTQETSYHIRGNARLKHLADEDILIDLCDDTKPVAVRAAPNPARFGRMLQQDIIQNEVPKPGTSYVRYYSRVMVATVDDVVELKALPPAATATNELRTVQPRPVGGSFFGFGKPVAGFQMPPGGEFLSGIVRDAAPVPPVMRAAAGPVANPPAPPSGGGTFTSATSPTPSIQTRVRPTVAVVLSGAAVRAGYPIVPPTLLGIGRYTAVPANRAGNGFVQELATSWFGVPIYAATWSLRWLLEGIDGQIPIPGNPLAGD